MALDEHLLGERLREARENCGLSQQRAADKLALPRTAITLMESGKRTVSTLELARLAELYHRQVQDFFAATVEPEGEMLRALYRLVPSLEENSQARDDILRYLDICREGQAVEALLGSGKANAIPSYAIPQPRTVWDAISQGQKLAEEERRRLGLGYSPISDMAELIADQGVWSAGVQFPDSISGVCLHHRSVGMVVLVNVEHRRWRKRFSYAHEYAHALIDADRLVNVTSSVNSSDLLEKRANAFAAAFLMPEKGVREFMESRGKEKEPCSGLYDVASDKPIEARARKPAGMDVTPQDVAMLAYHFGVSYQAAVYRLKDQNYVNRRESEGLLGDQHLGKDFMRLLRYEEDDIDGHEAKPRDRELFDQVFSLALEAFRREVISRGRLLDICKKLEIEGRRAVEIAEATRRYA